MTELLRIILIGDSGVGKSNIVLRYTKNEFSTELNTTTGVENQTKTVTIANQKIRVQLWDLAGQERYRSMAKAYYRGTHGVLLVLDVTKKSSFDNLIFWLNEVTEYSNTDMTIMLLANKTDISNEQAVPSNELREFAKKNNLFYEEVSAKDGTNIEKAFTILIEEIYRKIQKKQAQSAVASKSSSPIIDLRQPTPAKKKCCY